MDYFASETQENKVMGTEEHLTEQAQQKEQPQDKKKSKKQKKKGVGKFTRIFLIIMGIFISVCAFMAAKDTIDDLQKNNEPETLLSFDPYTASDLKQGVSFEMISYAFASFELSDAQGLYFVFDKDMYAYIVCMDNDRLETEFADIYEYTFSDEAEAPAEGWLEGYAMEIDEELMAIAIEEFNYLWDEEVVNEENFEEYLGSYYLDSTYVPDGDGESPVGSIFTAIFLFLVGGYLVYYGLAGYKRAVKKQEAEAAAAMAGNDFSAAANYGENAAQNGTSQTMTTLPGDIPVSRNIIVSLIATIVGAALGGLVWIVFYKMGRIVAIAGYLAVFGAIWGWTKVGKRALTKPAAVWCILIGAGMIVMANWFSYAWEISDALNATSKNRAEFSKILANMPTLMSEYELWGSFVGELAIGLVLALVAGLGGLVGKKKK